MLYNVAMVETRGNKQTQTVCAKDIINSQGMKKFFSILLWSRSYRLSADLLEQLHHYAFDVCERRLLLVNVSVV